MKKGAIYSLLLGAICFLFSCKSQPSLYPLAEIFPDSSAVGRHFSIIRTDHLEKPAFLTDTPVLDTSLQQMLEVPYGSEAPRAAFRFNINDEGIWGLVCYMAPDEGSSDWRYTLIPYDSRSNQLGTPLKLADRTTDCGQDILESWLQDVDNDGNIDVVTRLLTYALPNSQADYCKVGWPPLYYLTLWKYKDGQYRRATKKGIDESNYPMFAEKEMTMAFENEE